MKPFTTVAVAVFSLVCAGHVMRLCLGWEVLVNGRCVPLWVSAVGTLAAGTLAIMLWRESRNTGR